MARTHHVVRVNPSPVPGARRRNRTTPNDSCADMVRVGDLVQAYGDARSASLEGKVVSVGRVNVKVYLEVRFSPTGPWFKQTHTVPREAIGMIVRNGLVVCGAPRR